MQWLSYICRCFFCVQKLFRSPYVCGATVGLTLNHPESINHNPSPFDCKEVKTIRWWSQRARVVMRLAHISKKSMVLLPCRGARRGVLPVREPGRELLSWGISTATLAESMLRRGRWRPAVEPERWGVDDPDLCSITSSESEQRL